MKKITTLFTDIGGVLLTNGWDKKCRKQAAEDFHLDFADFEERHHLTFATYELGKLTLDQYLDRTVFYDPRNFTKDAFIEFMYAQSKRLPGMIELITGLKNKYHLKIAVVNNEGRELNAYRIQTFKLTEFVDFFISSCFVHYRKPDADIFKMALDTAQVDPVEVLYIEDRPMFVDEAQRLGISGIRHIDYESTCDMLLSFGFEL